MIGKMADGVVGSERTASATASSSRRALADLLVAAPRQL
jgi:hypothetical protein